MNNQYFCLTSVHLGYGLQERENPADFLLDIISESQTVIRKLLFYFSHVSLKPLHTIYTHVYSHSATKRRLIRKGKPANKLNLFKKYKHSEEARLIEKQLDHSHIETRPSATKRCGDRISYHFKNIPYGITSFFLQVKLVSAHACNM